MIRPLFPLLTLAAFCAVWGGIAAAQDFRADSPAAMDLPGDPYLRDALQDPPRELREPREPREPREFEVDFRGPGPAELHAHLIRLEAEIDALRRARRFDEAGPFAREADEVRAALEQFIARGWLPEDQPVRDLPSPDELEELERRIHHMFAAAENLHAAGLHEEADDLARHAEEMAAELQRMAGGEGPERELAAHVEELTEMVHDLRRQVFEMRHAIHELRAQVQELAAGR